MKKIALALFLALCGLPASGHEGHDKAFANNRAVMTTSTKVHITRSGQRSIGLKTEPVRLQHSKVYLDATGTVKAADDQIHYVTSPVSGVVRAIKAKQGDSVKKGQTLATIYSAEAAKVLGDLLDQKATINSELAKMQVESDREIDLQTKNTAHFANDLAREKQLLAAGVTARKNFLEAKHSYETSEIKLESIKKQQKQDIELLNERLKTIIDAARRHLIILGLPVEQINRAISSSEVNAEIPIQSPANGSIFLRDITLGESIDTAKHLFSIVKLSPIWVTIDIHQEKLAQLQIGQNVDITTPTGSKISGSISSIAAVVDPEDRTVSVRVVCDNSNGELKPQMFVTARILTATGSEKVVIVPPKSVLEDDDRSWVYVQYGDDFQPVSVKVGNRTANGIEILEGLFEGDRIVVNGARQIKSQSLLASSKADTAQEESAHSEQNEPAGFGNWILLATLLVGVGVGTGLTLLITRKRRSEEAEASHKEESLI